MKQIVLTLGAPNDEQGNLSPMAVDRLECTLGLYLHNDGVKILCTGDLVNPSTRPIILMLIIQNVF